MADRSSNWRWTAYDDAPSSLRVVVAAVYKCFVESRSMPKVDTDVRSILKRLVAEGWIVENASKHTKLFNPAKPGIKIMVPRHRTLESGTARSIARAAGWI